MVSKLNLHPRMRLFLEQKKFVRAQENVQRCCILTLSSIRTLDNLQNKNDKNRIENLLIQSGFNQLEQEKVNHFSDLQNAINNSWFYQYINLIKMS